MKKIPMRTCSVTREKCTKNELIRIVKTPEATVIIDQTGKANGRGAYLKKDSEVIKKAQKTKVLDRNLEISIPDSIYDELLELCK